MEAEAVALLGQELRRLLGIQEWAVLAVPGGRSVERVFSLLAAERLDWSRVHLFMVDERLVPPDHPDANFLIVKRSLSASLPAGNVHPFVFDPAVPDRGAEAYARDLHARGGRFDVVLLSAGEDGHVAALYPDHRSVRDRGGPFIVMDDSPKPPPMRMSSSRSLLEAATVGLVLFFGEAKREAFERFLDDALAVERLPAKAVMALPRWYALTDLVEKRGDGRP
jgi:6-phosphogluconolactonase